jgi:glycosyltransferase involved in cell wall biosynthesis
VTKDRSQVDGRVAIAWRGLPLYAAAAIARAVSIGKYRIDVIGTRPEVPAHGMEDIIGQHVHWIDCDGRTSFQALGLRVPSVLFITGWSVPSFMQLAREVRRTGGSVVCMADNSYRGDARQFVGAIAFRTIFRRLFAHVWVPGSSAARLMRFYGVPASRISQGLYTADTTIFQRRKRITDRPLRFVFAGQFISRKNVLGLCEAFLQFRKTFDKPCDLHLYGSGPLHEKIPSDRDIHVHSFASPLELATAFNDARCFILPSDIDHWGLVVHEAAACGALLIVSDTTGAGLDLCTVSNSRIVPAGNTDALAEALSWAAQLSQEELIAASSESVERASSFSVPMWAKTFTEICDTLLSQVNLHCARSN